MTNGCGGAPPSSRTETAVSPPADCEPELHRPVFLVGPMRAGTTMLRLMLDHHPLVRFFGEFEYPVHGITGDVWPDREAFLARVRDHRVFQSSQLDVPADLDARELTRSFFEQMVLRAPANVPGATVHGRFDLLRDVWPDARYVHLTRDPRDVARSTVQMGWAGNVCAAAEFWLKAEGRWDVVRSRTPAEQRHEVRYEELVEDPARVLGGICDFLGLPFDSRMLGYAEHSTYERPRKALREQWRAQLSAREVELVEWRCGALLGARGYQPVAGTPRPPGAAERVRLAWQDRCGRSGFAIRRYGWGLWAARAVSDRLPFGRLRSLVQARVNRVDRVLARG